MDEVSIVKNEVNPSGMGIALFLPILISYDNN